MSDENSGNDALSGAVGGGEEYAEALARITQANTYGDGRLARPMTQAQTEELQQIAKRQWGEGVDSGGRAESERGNGPAVETTRPYDAHSVMSPDMPEARAAAAERLTPYGLDKHAWGDLAGEAVAVVGMFEGEGVPSEQANALLKHLATGQPANDAQVRTAFASLSDADDALVVNYLNALDDAHPKLNVLGTLRRSGLLASAGFLQQVAAHAASRKR
jgi:hypothetical protein